MLSPFSTEYIHQQLKIELKDKLKTSLDHFNQARLYTHDMDKIELEYQKSITLLNEIKELYSPYSWFDGYKDKIDENMIYIIEHQTTIKKSRQNDVINKLDNTIFDIYNKPTKIPNKLFHLYYP